MLEARNLSVRYGSLTILDNVSFAVGDKQWVMIVGPNGAGKSTVVNAVSRGAPYTGQILLDGKDIRKYKSTELARKIGVLAQDTPVGYSFSVEEVVGGSGAMPIPAGCCRRNRPGTRNLSKGRWS